MNILSPDNLARGVIIERANDITGDLSGGILADDTESMTAVLNLDPRRFST